MEPNDAGARSSERAQELRASLGARRDLEALLAEASATRQAAAAQADELIEEAQELVQQLLAETRADAEQLVAEARERAEAVRLRAREEAEEITRQARSAADEVRARAEADVEEHRRRVRAEVSAQVARELEEHNRAALARQHERHEALIGDLEASVRILGVSLDSAAANVGEMLGALDDLRTHSAESLGEPLPAAVAVPGRAPAGERRTRPSIPAVDELFRSTSVLREDPADRDDRAARDERDGTGPGHEEEPPRSATEAFLRSAHIDHGDPPLPPMDDEEIGARYARDAMRATARARTRQDPETLGVSPERPSPARRGPDERGEPSRRAGAEAEDRADDRADDRAGDRGEGSETTDPAGKPLGWLFRSS